MTLRIPPITVPVSGEGDDRNAQPINSLWYRYLQNLQTIQDQQNNNIDTSLFGFKSLFQNDYIGVSEISLFDNGKSHVKEDATEVIVSNALPDAFLTTVINGNESQWMKVSFPEAVAVLQGKGSLQFSSLELAPLNLLSITKLKSGVFLVSGYVRNAQ